MKRISAVLAMSLMFTGCKADTNLDLFPRVYTFTASECVIQPKLLLDYGNHFSMTFAPESSYIAVGTYDIIGGDRVVLDTNDGLYHYEFGVNRDNDLVFDAEASSDMVWFGDMEDGCIFEQQ